MATRYRETSDCYLSEDIQRGMLRAARAHNDFIEKDSLPDLKFP